MKIQSDLMRHDVAKKINDSLVTSSIELELTHLPSRALKQLSEALRKISKFTIAGTNLSEEKCNIVVQAIKDSKTLRSITFKFHEFDSIERKLLSSILFSNKGVYSICILKSTIDINEVCSLVEASKNNSVIEMEFDNNFTEEELSKIAIKLNYRFSILSFKTKDENKDIKKLLERNHLIIDSIVSKFSNLKDITPFDLLCLRYGGYSGLKYEMNELGVSKDTIHQSIDYLKSREIQLFDNFSKLNKEEKREVRYARIKFNLITKHSIEVKEADAFLEEFQGMLRDSEKYVNAENYLVSKHQIASEHCKKIVRDLRVAEMSNDSKLKTASNENKKEPAVQAL